MAAHRGVGTGLEDHRADVVVRTGGREREHGARQASAAWLMDQPSSHPVGGIAQPPTSGLDTLDARGDIQAADDDPGRIPRCVGIDDVKPGAHSPTP